MFYTEVYERGRPFSGIMRGGEQDLVLRGKFYRNRSNIYHFELTWKYQSFSSEKCGHFCRLINIGRDRVPVIRIMTCSIGSISPHHLPV